MSDTIMYTSDLVEYKGEDLEFTFSELDSSVFPLVKAYRYSSSNVLIGEIVVPKAEISLTKAIVTINDNLSIGDKLKIEIVAFSL